MSIPRIKPRTFQTPHDEIAVALRGVVCHARTGGYGDAASGLNVCLQRLQPLLASVAVPRALLDRVTYSLETMFMMQKQDDWVAVADIIEYELIDLVNQLPVPHPAGPT